MIETIESQRPHVIVALTQAWPDGLTVRELRASLGAGAQVIRRILTVLLATGAVRQFLRYKSGVVCAVRCCASTSLLE